MVHIEVGVEVCGIPKLTFLHLLRLYDVWEEEYLRLILGEEIEGFGGTIIMTVDPIFKVHIGDAMVVLNNNLEMAEG